ncbi:MAG: acyltransferase [Bacteroidota bacterium]
MSIVENRSFLSIIKGIYIRILSFLAYVSFPYQVTNTLHRMRGVKVGKKAHIARYVFLDDRNPELITIEEGVAITTGVMILTHQRDLDFYKRGMYVMDCPFKEGKVLIKKGAHIGIGSIILPGVTIGEGAVIGAGSVVVNDIPEYSLALGVPAKVLKNFQD